MTILKLELQLYFLVYTMEILLSSLWNPTVYNTRDGVHESVHIRGLFLK